MQVQIIRQLPVAEAHRQVLAVDTVHQSIPTPKGEKKNTGRSECWVMGADNEPVKLVYGEFKAL